MSRVRKIVIMGAAGRDFHNFNVVFRDNPDYWVVAFTACQIPDIAGRVYPPELAGRNYPRGIPIQHEEQLPKLIKDNEIDEVVFSYSDIRHVEVMHRASVVNACGADFRLMGTAATTLASSKPVISVCAVRTGCGKSQTTRAIAEVLRDRGLRAVVVRHPMPYGDLAAQRCQRFSRLEDLAKHHCTIEEREEYESHIEMGHLLYAGVDYEEILRAAEAEGDVILWDGGNNDVPFYEPDLHVVLVDPHRPGHEIRYHPGETNLLTADVVLVAKTGTAAAPAIAEVKANIARRNPRALVIDADSVVDVPNPDLIRGSRVLVVEDGPTVTHGEMPYGAGHVAAVRWGAGQIVDPRPYAVGSILQTFAKYPHIGKALPAMGYSDRQIRELRQTIQAVPCDVVLVGTPFDLGRLLQLEKPVMRVSYELDRASVDLLAKEVDRVLSRMAVHPHPTMTHA